MRTATAGTLADDDGTLSSALGWLAQRSLVQGDGFFREVLDALPAAIYVTDASGRIAYFNEAAAALWGHRPALGTSEWCGSWKLFRPDGSALPHDQCPMALAIREKRVIRGMEAVAERPDGVRVPFIPFPTPLYDASGTLLGAVNMLVDITDRKRADQDVQRLASIVESSEDAIVSKDLDGIITSWNWGAQQLFGYAAEEIVGQPIMILIPAERQNEEPEILDRVRRGERIEHYETIRRRKDGSLVEISLTVSPIRNSEGRIVGASKIARNITERKRAQEQQALLLGEMRHRVKNLFAITSGLVAMSARSARTPADMAKTIRARLDALARAHALIRPGLIDSEEHGSQDTTLDSLVRAIFLPYDNPECSGDHESVVVLGPDVPISGNAITSMALVLHELATNSAKYGALSCPEGCVHVDWHAENGMLLLEWEERSGPPVTGPPAREGFGALLARRSIEDQLGGKFLSDWRPEGLRICLSVPLQRLTK